MTIHEIQSVEEYQQFQEQIKTLKQKGVNNLSQKEYEKLEELMMAVELWEILNPAEDDK